MSLSKRDLQLGKIALRNGMVTKEQLAKSIAIQKKLEKPVGLGAILIKKGYINKDQLEQIVKLHNEQKDGSSDKKNGVGPATKDKSKKKKKKKKDKDAKKAASESEAPASSEESKPTTSSEAPVEKAPAAEPSAPPEEGGKKGKSSKKEGKGTVLEKQGKKSDRKESQEGSISSMGSEVDAALLESVASDEGSVEETDDRRVVACSECSKKYRVKKKQAGKRFGCRKCNAKVKIPKDLFDRPPKPSKQVPAVAVEEFSLGGSSDDTSGDEDGEDAKKTARAKKDSGTQTATKKSGELAKSGPKPGLAGAGAKPAEPKKELSIAELAKAAAAHKPAALAPKKVSPFAYVQAGVLIAMALGIGGGIIYWRHQLEVERLAKVAAEKKAEFDRFIQPYEAAVTGAKDALAKAREAKEPNREVLAILTNALSDLEPACKTVNDLRPPKEGEKRDVVQPAMLVKDNIAQAIRRDDEVKSADLLRDLYLERGKTFLALGGEGPVHDAARDFQDVVARDPKVDEAFLLLGRTELVRRNYAAAIEALKKAVSLKPDPRAHAWLGLAYEAGDIPAEAVKAYEAIGAEPLVKVVKARALLAGGDPGAALAALQDTAGLEGEALGAAHVVRGLALEKKGDFDDADKAFKAAVDAGGPSGRAHVARGERHLRAGRYAEAAQDFDAALKVAGGARAAVGLGDARRGLLDTNGMKSAYGQAATLPILPSGALLHDIDAFDDPRSPDPRATALRRLGDAALGASRFDDARTQYTQALVRDPFDPQTRAAQAQLEVLAKNLQGAEAHVKAARALLRAGREKSDSGNEPLVHGAAAANCLIIEAIFWSARGELAKAEKALDDALAADAQAAGSRAYALKGEILARRSQPDASKAAYLKALELETKNKDAPSRFYAEALATFEGAKGDPAALQRARGACETVLALAPRHAHALCLRGRISIAEQKWDEALKDLTAAIDENKHFYEGYVARGHYFMRDIPAERRDEFAAEQAEKMYDLALSLDASSADVLLGRAQATWMRGNAAESLKFVNDAIRQDPTLADAYLLRSQIYFQGDKNAEGEADKKKAEELSKRASK